MPPGYSGYRSKEGYTGHRPRSDISNVRTSIDQLKSSEALQSIHKPQQGSSAQGMTHSQAAVPALPPSPHQKVSSRLSTPSPMFARKPDYEHMPHVEGYAGHRPTTPAQSTLGSGRHHLFNEEPREKSPDNPRVKILSHGRGLYVP